MAPRESRLSIALAALRSGEDDSADLGGYAGGLHRL